MKKSSKCLVLLALTTIIIVISGLFQPTNKINKNIGIQELKAYNHTTENALDNVFIQDNKIILPFIFKNESDANSLDIRTKFAKAGLTIKSISTENIGTGTQITVNENTNVYNVLIYGDVNGDGKINLIDVQRVILHHLGQSTLTGLYAMAANTNNTNGDINLIDAQRLILFHLEILETGLVVEEPQPSEPLNPGNPNNPTNPTNPNNPNRPSNPSNPDKPSDPFEKESTIKSDITMGRILCYEEISFTLTSEENISVDDLHFDIQVKKDGKLEDVEEGKECAVEMKKEALGDKQIKVTFEARLEGPYIITPKTNTVTGVGIKICVKPDESINNISLLPVSGSNEIDYVQDKVIKLEVKFEHKYPEYPEKYSRTISVKGPDYSNISKSISLASAEQSTLLEEGIDENDLADIKFLNEENILLSEEQDGDRIVKYIVITPKKVGKLNLSITVNNDNESKQYKYNGEISVREAKLVVNPTEINLYHNETKVEENGDSDNTVIVDEVVYTLIQVSPEVDTASKFKVEDIAKIVDDNKWTGKICIVDNIIDSASEEDKNSMLDFIVIKPFSEDEEGNKTIIDNPHNGDANYINSEISYIGIAINKEMFEIYNEKAKGLNSVNIYYRNQEEPISIKVEVIPND